ncbi:MAG TPA: glutathione S-transferase N-terminal domain-containing protein [Thermoleophilaceae bacterium]|nr:glutathione S-transferase N-terminal domain-containing protein [Thermoleophilaceae bacterium]
MKLYTCGQKGTGRSLPWPVTHACGAAMKALEQAGHDYELEVVPGYRLLPWTRRGDARAEIRQLTGQDNVPVLLLDDGTAIAGSGNIVDWAQRD